MDQQQSRQREWGDKKEWLMKPDGAVNRHSAKDCCAFTESARQKSLRTACHLTNAYKAMCTQLREWGHLGSMKYYWRQVLSVCFNLWQFPLRCARTSLVFLHFLKKWSKKRMIRVQATKISNATNSWSTELNEVPEYTTKPAGLRLTNFLWRHQCSMRYVLRQNRLNQQPN